MLRRPPSILATTPESLALMLDSPSSRAMLAAVRLLVLDEIHALAGDKRGAMLACSVGRLALLAGEFQRVALSATARPVEAIADFVGGRRLVRGLPGQAKPDGRAGYRKRAVCVVAPVSEKLIELAVEWPEGPDGPTPAERRLRCRTPLQCHHPGDRTQAVAQGGNVPRDHRLHRLAAARRADGLPHQRGDGGGHGLGPSRLALQGDAPRRRGALQVRGAGLCRRHGIAGARDRHRQRRGGRPRRKPSLGGFGLAEGRALGSRRGRGIAGDALSLPWDGPRARGGGRARRRRAGGRGDEAAVVPAGRARPGASRANARARAGARGRLGVRGAQYRRRVVRHRPLVPAFRAVAARALRLDPADARRQVLGHPAARARAEDRHRRRDRHGVGGKVGEEPSVFVGGDHPRSRASSACGSRARTRGSASSTRSSCGSARSGKSSPSALRPGGSPRSAARRWSSCPRLPIPTSSPSGRGKPASGAPRCARGPSPCWTSSATEARTRAPLSLRRATASRRGRPPSARASSPRRRRPGPARLPSSLARRLVLEEHAEAGSRGDTCRLVLHTLRGLAVNEPLAIALAAAMEEECGLPVQKVSDDDLVLLSRCLEGRGSRSGGRLRPVLPIPRRRRPAGPARPRGPRGHRPLRRPVPRERGPGPAPAEGPAGQARAAMDDPPPREEALRGGPRQPRLPRGRRDVALLPRRPLRPRRRKGARGRGRRRARRDSALREPLSLALCARGPVEGDRREHVPRRRAPGESRLVGFRIRSMAEALRSARLRPRLAPALWPISRRG